MANDRHFNFRIHSKVAISNAFPVEVSNIPPETHSLVVEFYGSGGGIFRYFPRGRSQMQLSFRFEEAGHTQVLITARDARLQTLGLRQGEFEVTGTSAASASERHGQAMLTAGPVERPVAALPQAGKPPMARVVMPGGTDDSLPRLGGWFMGPSEVGAGETVSISLNGGSEGHAARLSVSGGSLSSSFVQLLGSSASVQATASETAQSMRMMAQILDSQQRVIGEVSHVMSIVARNIRGGPGSIGLGAGMPGATGSTMDALRQINAELAARLKGKS